MRRVLTRTARATLVMLVLGGSIDDARAAGDPERGKRLHESCLSCHSTELYVPPRRKISSLPALAKEVERWNRSYNPKFTKAEIEDLVAYLNRDFYQFTSK